MSLSASVMLKGKLAVATVHSHSSLLKAVLAQDSLGDKLLSAQRHPLTEAGARASGCGAGKIYNQVLLGETLLRTQQGSPTLNASQGKGLPGQGASAPRPSGPTSFVLDRQVAFLGNPDSLSRACLDPQGILRPCPPVGHHSFDLEWWSSTSTLEGDRPTRDCLLLPPLTT